mmetsp:Transcript_9226/g.56062  ORF Transcript_9226/g.56062 Transcript_9226/m.56062 type:complete len:198 (+) Transcript_9226:832-1425(+)
MRLHLSVNVRPHECAGGVFGASSLHHPNAFVEDALGALVAPMHDCVLHHSSTQALSVQDLCFTLVPLVSFFLCKLSSFQDTLHARSSTSTHCFEKALQAEHGAWTCVGRRHRRRIRCEDAKKSLLLRMRTHQNVAHVRIRLSVGIRKSVLVQQQEGCRSRRATCAAFGARPRGGFGQRRWDAAAARCGSHRSFRNWC